MTGDQTTFVKVDMKPLLILDNLENRGFYSVRSTPKQSITKEKSEQLNTNNEIMINICAFVIFIWFFMNFRVDIELNSIQFNWKKLIFLSF